MSSSLYAGVMDLQQAIDYALLHHIDLKVNDNDRQVRWHQLSVLQQKFSPQVTLSMSGTIHHEEYFNEQFDEQKLHAYPTLRLQTPIGTVIELFSDQNIGYELGQRKTGAAIHVVIDQPLLQGRKKIINTWSIDSAKIADEIEALAREKTIENVIYHVVLAYHALVIQNRKQALQERWIKQAKQFFQSLQAKYGAGRVAENDLRLAHLQYKQAKFQLKQIEAERRQVERQFYAAIGWREGELTVSDKSYPAASYLLNDKEKWLEKAHINDVETKILNLNYERLKRELIVAKDKQLYDLRLRGNLTFGRYHIFGNELESDVSDDYIYTYPFIHQSGNYSAELQLNIPLTGKQERYHQELAIRTAMQNAQYEQENHKDKLNDDMLTLLDAAQLANTQCKLAKETLELMELNYKHTLMKYEAGRTSLFEVEMVKDKWKEAENRFFSQEVIYYNNLANVELHSGLLRKKWQEH